MKHALDGESIGVDTFPACEGMRGKAARLGPRDAGNLAVDIDGHRRGDLQVLVVEHGAIRMVSLPVGE